MAKVKYIIPVEELTGSIGGTTFQSNRSGFFCRAKPTKCNSLSFDRNIINNFFYNLLQKFQLLSEANKTLWKDFADAYTFTNRYGEAKHLTAFNWFVMINSNLYNVDEKYTEIPLSVDLPVAIGSYVMKLWSNTIKIIFDTTPADPYSVAFVFTTAPMMRLTTSFRGRLKLTKVLNPFQLKEYDITEDWKNTHNLSYPPVLDTDRFFVGICICGCHIISGLTGAYLCSNAYFSNISGGIGDMIIDDDFVVS